MAIVTLNCLPPEIFTRIIYLGFRREEDLSFLWNECRNVSKYWRRTIEDFVRKRHLFRTSISYDVGDVSSLDDLGTCSTLPSDPS